VSVWAKALGVAVVLHCSAGTAGAQEAVTGQIVVGFSRGTRADRIHAIVERAGGAIKRRLGAIDAAAVRPRPGRRLADLRAALRRARSVRYVEPDFVLHASRSPDDPLYFRQYALAPAATGDIAAPQAWDVSTSCAKVATLDSGLQYSHPDLAPNVWHNPHEIKDNGKDDDHNGYVDDYYGVDVHKGSGSGGDDDGHGTHVAGIIGGRGNNGVGVAGTCWSTSIMSVRFMDSHGRGSTSDAVAGLQYAVHQGAKIVNCSFGSSSKSSALQDAVEYAKENDVLLVVAAGNDGESLESHPEYPASYTDANIIAVAATTATDALADFSDYGSKSVDLAAPGEGIYSTYPTSSYRYLDGTSMAAPFVTGAAAMLRAKDPSLTYAQLRSTLLASVDQLPSLQGRTATGGRLDLDRAIERTP
jgi:subtilisin family serine protease